LQLKRGRGRVADVSARARPRPDEKVREMESTMTTFVRAASLLAVLASPTAWAAGSVYAVLPTQGAGATAEAAVVAQTMRLTLQEQSLAEVPAGRVDSAVLANTVACTQSVAACGRLVGQATSATHVVLSELWDQAGTFELRVALLDVRVESPPSWTTYRTTTSAELGPLAKKAALGLVTPGALAGGLSVQGPRDVELVVDGVVVDRTPLLQPVRLSSGVHELELRSASAGSFRQSIRVESGQTVEVVACVQHGALTAAPDACPPASTTAPTTTENPLPVLGVAGGAVLGVATLTGVVAGAFAYDAMTAWGRYVQSANEDDEAKVRQSQSVAVGMAAVAGALALTGAGLVAAELLLEDSP
jgi:hypothetical protein